MDIKYNLGIELFVSTLPFLAMLVCYLFCFWLPAQKSLKDQELFQNSICLGDHVVTKSGICGVVIGQESGNLTIKSIDSTIKVKAWAIKEKI